jgi:hypothetical protein
MNRLINTAGVTLVLMSALNVSPAWSQTVSKDSSGCGPASASYNPVSTMSEDPLVMDQNLSREIKQAWSEGKNATAAMAFQENGEIALNKGKDREARQYFAEAERELATLQPEQDY